MHFRMRGNSIQVVRTSYDAEKKGAKSEVVGRLPRRGREVPEELKGKLNAAELTELTAYLEQTKSIEDLRRKVTAHSLGQTVGEAVEYAQDVTDEAERDRLHAIFAEAVVALRRVARAGKPEAERGDGGGGGRRGKGARGEDTAGLGQAA